GRENLGHFAREPIVPLLFLAEAGRRKGVHVVGEVRYNEIVAGDVVVFQVGLQFGIGADMFDAPGLIGGDVVEEDERIVASDVGTLVIAGIVAQVEALLVCLPGDAGIFQERDQVVGRADVIAARVVVVKNAEVGPGFE